MYWKRWFVIILQSIIALQLMVVTSGSCKSRFLMKEASMYTICVNNNLINIRQTDDIFKAKNSYSIRVSGKITEISDGSIATNNLDFNSHTMTQIQHAVRHIIKCMENDDHCRSLKNNLKKSEEDIVNIEVALQEKNGKYIINNIFMNGEAMILKKRRIRRNKYACPPGFICLGIQNLTATNNYKTSSRMSKKSLIPCNQKSTNCFEEGMNSQSQNVLKTKTYLVDFHVYKSLSLSQKQSKHSQYSTRDARDKHFKGINIKRIFGRTTNKQLNRNLKNKRNVFGTLRNAFSRIMKN